MCNNITLEKKTKGNTYAVLRNNPTKKISPGGWGGGI